MTMQLITRERSWIQRQLYNVLTSKHTAKLGVTTDTFHLGTSEAERHGNCCEFKGSLVYKESSRTARATLKHPILKKYNIKPIDLTHSRCNTHTQRLLVSQHFLYKKKIKTSGLTIFIPLLFSTVKPFSGPSTNPSPLHIWFYPSTLSFRVILWKCHFFLSGVDSVST